MTESLSVNYLECHASKADFLIKSDWFAIHDQSNVVSLCALSNDYQSKRWNALSIKTSTSHILKL